MKKYIIGMMVLASVWACSKEDWPDNSAPERNWLAPDEDATDETSVLRREFYARNGIYLLFSDTLGIREKTTLAGETVYDWQILGYEMTTQISQDSFAYHSYSVYAEQEAAAIFVEEQVFPNISKAFWPGAVLLLDKLEYFKHGYFPENGYMPGFKPAECIAAQNNLQAMIFGLGNVLKLTVEEKDLLKNALFKAMILSKISILPVEDLELFYNYSKDYYNVNGYTITNAGLTYQDVGLLTKLEDSYISTTSKDYDIEAFIERIFTLSKAEFYEQFSGFPLVIKKMEALVDVLHKYGVKIYMEE